MSFLEKNFVNFFVILVPRDACFCVETDVLGHSFFAIFS